MNTDVTKVLRKMLVAGMITIASLSIFAEEDNELKTPFYSTTRVPRDSVAQTATSKVDRRYRPSFLRRWNIYGFAEVGAMRNFNSLGNRNSHPADGFPVWDMHLPKANIWITFDCGKGWSVGTEVDFDNPATVAMSGPGRASSRKVEWDMGIELAEFWIQKSFSEAANLKVGLISTPVGQTNDLPTDFFGITRPEDGPAYLPLDYSTVGIDFNGAHGPWSYEVMVIPGLTGYDFGNSSWKYGEDGTYEQSLSRLYAGAFRIGNSSVEGLDLALSGEFGGGNTWFKYEMPTGEEYSRDIRNGVSLASFDFHYNNYNWIARGAYQYGYVSNTTRNAEAERLFGRVHDLQAMSASGEVGYDFFSLSPKLNGKQKFYVFGRFAWNQYQDYSTGNSYWNNGHRFSFGVNWMPIPTIVVKGEVGFGYGNDPARSFVGLSVGWSPST